MLYFVFLSSGRSLPGNGNILDDLLLELKTKYPSPITIHMAVLAIAIDAAHCVSPPPMSPNQMTATIMTMLATKPAIGMTYLDMIERRSLDSATMATMHVTPYSRNVPKLDSNTTAVRFLRDNTPNAPIAAETAVNTHTPMAGVPYLVLNLPRSSGASLLLKIA